jgi:hypothetical protein
MLGKQDIYVRGGGAAGILNRWEDVSFLQLLFMVVLAESPKKDGGILNGSGGDGEAVCAEVAGNRLVHQKNSPENSMLAHQVLGGGYLWRYLIARGRVLIRLAVFAWSFRPKIGVLLTG